MFDGDRGYAAYLASLSYYALCLALTWWAGLRGQAGSRRADGSRTGGGDRAALGAGRLGP